MPMTRQQAELAVDRDARLRGLGPNREAAIRKVMQMDPDQLVSNVPAGSPLARNVTRQTAISAAMGGPEEPRVVTPATPAPMRPGIPIMAPRPEARQLMPADVRQMAAREEAGMSESEVAPAAAAAPVRAAPAPAVPAAPKSSYVSPARIAAREAEREMTLINQVVEALAKEGQPVPPEARIRLERAQQRFASATAEANAEEAAQIDAERAAIFARQEGLLKDREERVGREEKNAFSDALIQGGLALMNPRRGDNFLAALSGGLGQGLETYDAAKAKAVEARARLGSETNALALQRIDALTQARSAAVNAIRRGDEVDERTARMAKMTDDQVIAAATQPQRIEAASLAPRVIQAAIAKDEASADAYRASADKDRRTDPNLRSTGDGVSDTARFNAAEDAKKKAIERQDTVREKFKDWQKSANGKAMIRSGPEWAEYESELRIYRALRKQAGLEGVLPDLGATSPGERAAKKARSTQKSGSGLPADVAAKYGL